MLIVSLLFTQNAQNGLDSCRIETIDGDAAQNLVPKLNIPLNTAFYMPQAVNINSQRYLEVSTSKQMILKLFFHLL